MRARDFFGKTLTPLDRLALNTSVMLVNGHFSLNSARPTVPGLAEVGGLHIPKNLPQPDSVGLKNYTRRATCAEEISFLEISEYSGNYTRRSKWSNIFQFGYCYPM